MSVFAPSGFCAGCRHVVSALNDFKFGPNGELLHRACEMPSTIAGAA